MTLREDRIVEMGERRWHALGLAAGLEPILLVVHVYREASDGEEIIRIISARKARQSECRAYLQ
ncbi:MAG: BrnT family toxin [Acidobacteria bacterium]|nr:BrnT family toxin [Acidobacteriota bacterium]